jgi:hypothetical protein
LKEFFIVDLAAKAAALEGRTDGKPSADVNRQLNDILAMVNKMEFFGRVTKRATTKGKVEDFFTIPVRLFYKDKDTREIGEARLRQLCKVNATTPYHRTLRAAIRQTVENCKGKYPHSFIQVKVDAERFLLKVSRLQAGVWYNNVEVINLSESVLDLSRSGPKENFTG